jgi:outer membrane cobalamin receptor
MNIRTFLTITLLLLAQFDIFSLYGSNARIYGTISTSDNEPAFATVSLKNTRYGTVSAYDGSFRFEAPAGSYTLVVSSLGYETVEKEIVLSAGQRLLKNIMLTPSVTQLAEITVSVSAVSRINRSAYNAVAIDTRAMQNTTRNLGDALARAPGVRLREAGGLGSDMSVMLDGFSGRHVRVFIDGVPQEGVGNSFGLNNIPVNFAERIEVYRGVVPVGFGTDAIGGVINIVTRRDAIARDRWFLNAGYSFGSFNTHRSHVNFGQIRKNGFTYEINAFQNYSDNNYNINTRVRHFLEDGMSHTPNREYRVRRFHDTFRSEAIGGRIGVVGRPWADRLMFGVTYSQMYNQIQNGVRQEIVFGGRYRRGHSLMPSLEYCKRNVFAEGLDIRLTANYNHNQTDNVDTSRYEFNWFGEKRPRINPGEQTFQHLRMYNNNWNGTFNVNYRIGTAHLFTFNHTHSAFRRNSRSMLTANAVANAISSDNRKSVSGLSYRFMPTERWNMSVFGKYYTQFVGGPVAQTAAQDSWVRETRSADFFGYGFTGTLFITRALQTKFSYEKACRMPTNNEMFGDGDLEGGNFTLRPESSHNLNFSLSYDNTFGQHALFAEIGFIYRNTRDYIMRTIVGTGGRSEGQHVNHGRVLTQGYNLTVRYGFSRWLSAGGNFTQMNARNNVRTTTNENENVTFGARMPNLPYRFANGDVTFFWHNFGRNGNLLTISYDNQFMHSFPLNFENVGYADSKRVVPTQFSHNIIISYSMRNGRYNLSFESHNITNARLYDSFSLQKPGRAFFGKLRVYLNSD